LINVDIDTYILSILHFGTTLALLVYFLNLFKGQLFSKKNINLYLKVILSAIPAGIGGLFLESVVENILRGTLPISLSLIVWGIAMILIERNMKGNTKDLSKVTWKQSITMGFAQILALIPGTSRSGITTITGILTGVDKYVALQFSFLMGIPLLLGASSYGILKGETLSFSSMELLGILLTGIVTFLLLNILKRFSKKNWLTLFGIYRIALGVAVLIFA
jgi:undecaprenyl-diphosphatase